MSDALRVSVVVDRDDRKRREFWSEVLRRLDAGDVLSTDVQLQPLSDMMAQPLRDGEQVFLERLQSQTDVLIVNWDAINDDPDFGADRALQWFRHRRTVLRRWVNDGGVLVLEGQANGGVPLQEAYDAVLGKGELSVCGAEDLRDNTRQRRRAIGECRVTPTAQRAPGFQILGRVVSQSAPTQDDMFPKETAGRLVGASLRRDIWPWRESIYRGWFQRRWTWRRRTLSWVPYIRRANGWPANYATMMTARCGRGVYFVSTMLLASTNQEELITAMLRVHGQAERLPEPWALRREVGRLLASGMAGALGALLTFLAGPQQEGAARAVAPAALGTAIAIFLYFLPAAGRALSRLVRRLTGE